MFPRLQPPKSRPPPQKLHLNTQVQPEQKQETFTADVMSCMNPTAPSAPAAPVAAAPAVSETAPLSNELFDQQSAPLTNEMSSHDWYEAYKHGEITLVHDIGEGSGGMVRLCELRVDERRPYAPAAALVGKFALKEIPANPDMNLRKQILRELQINRSCRSQYIVKYYGAFFVEEVGQIFIAMEYCDGGSLDAVMRQISKKEARIGERVLAYIAYSVLSGITYLYSRKVIHRDIKPQNILLCGNGDVKLCDFGVSGEVVNSLVTTFTGTSYYMAPERIRGQPYTVTSDVWSLGLTLMELALNKFPFDASTPLTPIELLTQIVNSPPPELPCEEGIKWSDSFKHFLKCCLEKDSAKRPSPQKLLSHPWIRGSIKKDKPFDMAKFVRQAWE